MGQACSRCVPRSGAAVAPLCSGEPRGNTTAASALLTSLHAAEQALQRRGGPTVQQAAALLDAVLAALLAAAGLEQLRSIGGAAHTPSGTSPKQLRPPPAPATVDQLVGRLQHGCALAGCKMGDAAAAAAPLAARLLESWRGTQLRQTPTEGAPAVPAADRLVSWLHTLLYTQVGPPGAHGHNTIWPPKSTPPASPA